MFHFNYLADFQKSSEQVAKLQKLHKEELASKEQELAKKLQIREREFREQMKVALVSTCFDFGIGYKSGHPLTPSQLEVRLLAALTFEYAERVGCRQERDCQSLLI